MAFRLRRITSSGRFVPEIDGLRFVAILSVVVYHFHGFVPMDRVVPGLHDWVRPAAAHGYRGVNLFYVISGFILGLPFAAHRLQGRPAVSLRSYFLRRLTRLEPPYILNLLLCFALLAAVSGESARALLPHLAASLVYLHNLWFGQQSTINPVAWTLEVEVQFYCLAPLLAMVFRIRSKPARRALLIASILLAGALQMMYWDAPGRVRLTILFAVQYFLTGLLMADVYLADWKEQPAPALGVGPRIASVLAADLRARRSAGLALAAVSHAGGIHGRFPGRRLQPDISQSSRSPSSAGCVTRFIFSTTS